MKEVQETIAGSPESPREAKTEKHRGKNLDREKAKLKNQGELEL